MTPVFGPLPWRPMCSSPVATSALARWPVSLPDLDGKPFEGISLEAVTAIQTDSLTNPLYKKPLRPLPDRKVAGQEPAFRLLYHAVPHELPHPAGHSRLSGGC